MPGGRVDAIILIRAEISALILQLILAGSNQIVLPIKCLDPHLDFSAAPPQYDRLSFYSILDANSRVKLTIYVDVQIGDVLQRIRGPDLRFAGYLDAPRVFSLERFHRKRVYWLLTQDLCRMPD